MREIPFSDGLAPDVPSADAANKTPSRWKRAIFAAFLSFLIPGMGQLYNRQRKKALSFAAATWTLPIIASQTRILFVFGSMIAFFVSSIAWRLFIVADAARGAAGAKATVIAPNSKLAYFLLAVLLTAGGLFPTNDQFKRWSGFAAYKVPSISMCPTVCSSERMIVDMYAYKSKSPTRGDIIMLERGSQSPLLIKRVVAIPGDDVVPGHDRTIVVNGVPLAIPQTCAPSTQIYDIDAEYPVFQPTKVPAGTLFVVGDNLASSFDSRSSDFGPVTFGQVRGRPLYIYWSQDRSRMGCAIH